MMPYQLLVVLNPFLTKFQLFSSIVCPLLLMGFQQIRSDLDKLGCKGLRLAIVLQTVFTRGLIQ